MNPIIIIRWVFIETIPEIRLTSRGRLNRDLENVYRITARFLI